ncbi:MAG TPA: hypothetical protein VHE30_01435 [Polyangiaceae bacterium]|nr:hypothetical protein [Polyangiaceae bacterium]
MKLARVVVSCALALMPAAACSDPPSPPSEGAVAITVSVGAAACPQAGGLITAPPGPAGYPDAVNNALQCSLANGNCDPRSYLVTDGDNGAAVACVVSGGGSSYNVSVGLITSPRMSFRASGVITMSPDGLSGTGNLQLSQSGANFPGNAILGTCQVDIKPNLGHIEPGAIWARFNCTELKDPSAAGDESCLATGSFYFDRCGK